MMNKASIGWIVVALILGLVVGYIINNSNNDANSVNNNYQKEVQELNKENTDIKTAFHNIVFALPYVGLEEIEFFKSHKLIPVTFGVQKKDAGILTVDDTICNKEFVARSYPVAVNPNTKEPIFKCYFEGSSASYDGKDADGNNIESGSYRCICNYAQQ